MGPKGLEDLLREPVDARVILVNVMKHIVEALAGLGSLRLVAGSLLTRINNEHTLHTYNIMLAGEVKIKTNNKKIIIILPSTLSTTTPV